MGRRNDCESRTNARLASIRVRTCKNRCASAANFMQEQWRGKSPPIWKMRRAQVRRVARQTNAWTRQERSCESARRQILGAPSMVVPPIKARWLPEHASIRRTPVSCSPVREVAIDAVAALRDQAFRQWNPGSFRSQESPASNVGDRRTRASAANNADGVPWLSGGCLRHRTSLHQGGDPADCEGCGSAVRYASRTRDLEG